MLGEFQHERPRRRFTPCKGPGIGYPFQRPEVHPQKEKTMTSLVRSKKQPYADDHRGDDVFTITFKLSSPSKDSSEIHNETKDFVI
ncbi:hypothetical protein J6590_048547 [Homalodisca vitripennis]|nr:hypothetical protein J6590_048547 [Homalodisca vitripennis]